MDAVFICPPEQSSELTSAWLRFRHVLYRELERSKCSICTHSTARLQLTIPVNLVHNATGFYISCRRCFFRSRLHHQPFVSAACSENNAVLPLGPLRPILDAFESTLAQSYSKPRESISAISYNGFWRGPWSEWSSPHTTPYSISTDCGSGYSKTSLLLMASWRRTGGTKRHWA